MAKDGESRRAAIEAPERPRKRPAYARRKKRHNEICQILIRHGAVRAEHVRTALRHREAHGGQIGRILVAMNACTERAIARALLEQVQRRKHAAGASPRIAHACKGTELAGLEVLCRPGATTAALFAADAAVLLVIASCAAGCDALVAHHLAPSLFHYGFAALALTSLTLTALGTYSPIASSPSDEIRTTTLTVTFIFVCGALVGMFRWEAIPWHICVLRWLVSTHLLLLPSILECAARETCTLGVVGCPGRRSRRRADRACSVRADGRTPLGLRPVFILDSDTRKQGTLRARG